MRKVGLIGCGHVGATVALDIVQGGLVDEMPFLFCRSMSKFMLENILI